MLVVFTASAEAELEQIGDFIAADNPARALSFVLELKTACQRLAEAPQAFPLVARYERLGVRKRVFEAYIVFYRVTERRIEILHIVHGSRDYETMLFLRE